MSYSDDIVKSKLSALNETQESIVTAGQWLMFHRRYADRTAQIWLQRVKDSNVPKRLNLIYLANEIAQQSKHRKKEEFLSAFSPIIAEAVAVAYKGATTDVQLKIRRVVEVWRQRQIFDNPTQDAVEARIDELDKNRGGGKRPMLGGSLRASTNGSTVPAELEPLVPLTTALSKLTVPCSTNITKANTEYDALLDPSKPVPTPPVHAAKLNSLLKSLAQAESSVAESIKARQALIDGLEKLIGTHRTALEKDTGTHSQMAKRKTEIEAKRLEVEDSIMRGMAVEQPLPAEPEENLYNNGMNSPERPVVEELTPPPVEALTPPAGDDADSEDQAEASFAQPSVPSVPGADLLSSLTRLRESETPDTNGSAPKKLKTSHADEESYAGFAQGELDSEVQELLRQESGATGFS